MGQDVVGQNFVGQDVVGAISLGQEVSGAEGSGAGSRESRWRREEERKRGGVEGGGEGRRRGRSVSAEWLCFLGPAVRDSSVIGLK